MEILNSKYIRFVAVVLAAFLLVQTLGALKSIDTIGVSPTTPNTISVSGTGEAFSVPDIATFSFGASATGKTVDDAQKQVTTIINAALAKVKKLGVEDKDVQTIDYSANPKYEYNQIVCVAYPCPPGKQTLVGYEVRETISVKVRKVADAGTILGAIGGTGVTDVSGLSFTVDDPSKVEAEARTKAIADAKSKAEELAKELGVRLVRIVSFSENGGGYPQPMFLKADMATGMGGASSAPSIPVGQNKVTSNVSITYEIR
jgi:hypothetical protein